MKNITVIRIPTTLNNFFKLWCKFIRPLHNLTDREMDVAAGFLYKRFLLSKSITDQNLLDRVLMSEESKKDIRKIVNISVPHFQVVMAKLRQNKVVIDNKINPKFIPDLTSIDNYKLLFNFEINETE